MNTKRLMIKGPAGNIPPLVDGLRAIAPTVRSVLLSVCALMC